MAASKVRADYEQLAAIAQLFGSQAETAQRVLGALQKNVSTLQGGDWAGKGSEAFYAEMNGAVLPSMERLVAALNGAASTTRKVSQIMKQAEDDSAALFRLARTPERGAGGFQPARQAPGPSTAAFVGGNPAAGGPGGSAGPAPAAPRPRTGAAQDPRAEKVQPVLDEANTLKEKYEKAWSDRFAARRAVQKAKREGKDPREIARLKQKLDEAQRIQDACEKLMNAKFEEAAQLTIQLYKIDVSTVSKIKYNGEGDVAAITWSNRMVELRHGAFDSPGWLASTILHESIHTQQIKEKRMRDMQKDPQGYAMNEIEAYHQELANAKRNGLTQAEIDEIKENCQEHYKNLKRENKERVNRGLYKPA